MNEKRLSEAGQVVRRHDHDRYLTALFAETGHREELFALYAFNYEIAKTAEVVSESMLGHIRLQWWREALEGLFAGMPRRHYVLDALAEAAGREAVAGGAQQLIDAREQDLSGSSRAISRSSGLWRSDGSTAPEGFTDLMSLSADRHESLQRHDILALPMPRSACCAPFHSTRRSGRFSCPRIIWQSRVWTPANFWNCAPRRTFRG